MTDDRPAADAWDPAQYERFRDQRSRPFHDLLALVRARPGMRVADLGCGTGELTRALHRRLRAAETLGVDSSPAMLARAREHTEEGLRFELGDIAAFAPPAPFDLVFSNAALHWLPDHASLLARLHAALRPGGQLAVQVPANFDAPSHTLARQVAAEAPFREALAGGEHEPGVLAPERYARRLHELGFAEQHVRLQVYAHVLASRDEVVEWVKGTLLTRYQARLGPELYARFEARYREAVCASLPDERPFFFPFKRILIWAGGRPDTALEHSLVQLAILLDDGLCQPEELLVGLRQKVPHGGLGQGLNRTSSAAPLARRLPDRGLYCHREVAIDHA